MKTVKVVIISIISVVIVAATVFFLIGFFRPKPAGLSVDSNPTSSIYVDGSFVGKTPYKAQLKAGAVGIKLVPDDGNLVPYETKVSLISGIETVVRREFGKSEDESSGDVLLFERLTGGETGLIVISNPENAQVSVDGLPQGFAPYKTTSMVPAKHQISIKAPGYTDRIMTIQVVAGFRLTVYAKLAKIPQEEQKTEETSIPKFLVEIQNTPTGFLRVRTQQGSEGDEIAQVKPGNTFPFLAEDAKTGWLQIQYEPAQPGLPNGITGWVSGQYAKKVEATASAQAK